MNSKKQAIKSKSKSRSKIDDEKTGVELDCEPRVVLIPLKGHSRVSSVSSNLTYDLSRPGTFSISKRRKYDTETDIGKEDDLEVLGGVFLTAVADERREM